MIDFVRIQYKDKASIEPFICQEENFEELTAILEYHTGETQYPYKTKIENIEITINDKYIYVKNSFHKLNNILNEQGNQNFNDFTYSSLCFVIDYLLEKLPDLDSAIITQIEFGLNINTRVPAEKIIKHSVIMHLLKVHNHNKRFNGKGEYKQFDHSNYLIKVYDKAKQFKRDENILRFEVKFIKRIEFNRLGISCVSDLKSKDSLNNLFGYLIRRFNELLIVDEVYDKQIPDKVLGQLRCYLSPQFWLSVSDRAKRNQKSKHKENLNKILMEHDLMTTKGHLSELLSEKFNQLINS